MRNADLSVVSSGLGLFGVLLLALALEARDGSALGLSGAVLVTPHPALAAVGMFLLIASFGVRCVASLAKDPHEAAHSPE